MKISKAIILDTARLLFNEQGLAPVTARVICSKLQISPGSFSYHFPDKSRLITELYRLMTIEMTDCMRRLESRPPGIDSLVYAFQEFARVQLRFKFFFLNLFEILHNFPAIKQLHQRAIIRERMMGRDLVKLYKKMGLIDTTVSPKEIRLVIQQNQVLYAYWIIDAELSGLVTDEQKIMHYTEVCLGPLLPFLTPAGKVAYSLSIKKRNK